MFANPFATSAFHKICFGMAVLPKYYLRCLRLGIGLLMFGAPILQAQNFERLNYPVEVDGRDLTNAWAGGLNCPQVSPIDLNQDGFMDLHLFDRVGSVHLTFLHDGVPGSTNYQHAPEYQAIFPEIEAWMMIRDYNGDQIPDIFSYSDIPGIDGISVFKGSYEDGSLRFDKVLFGKGLGIT